MSIVKEIGQSGRVAIYEVPDTEMATGSTLGGPKAACIIKATGAIETVYSIDIGQNLFGTVLLRHYDGPTGMHLSPQQPGTFVIHPEHQEHKTALPNGVQVHETIFVHSGPTQADGAVDPPGVYLMVALHNAGADVVEMQTYAYADLRGQTGHDVVVEYDAGLNALVAWNTSQPDWVRLFGCSDAPASHETTLDYGQAVASSSPGALSGNTDTPTDPLGVFQHTRTLAPGETVQFYLLLSFGAGRADAESNYKACPPAGDALARTQARYHEALGRAVLVTPKPR